MIHLTAVFLFFLLGARLFLAAPYRPFWGDEAVGITGTVWNSFATLIQRGPSGEVSPSPLHYLLEKSWLAAWNVAPQLHWDLRVFFRTLPVLYWTLAAIVVLYSAYYFLRQRGSEIPPWAAICIASGISIFFHANDFGAYYALEDRSYSLWIFLSTLHFALFMYSFVQASSPARWAAYLVVSFLLVATTYVSLAQVILALLLQVLHQGLNRKNIPWLVGIAASSTFVGLHFSSGIGHYAYGDLSYGLYRESLFTVTGKTFHNHGAESTYFVLPLCYLLTVWVYRRDKLVRPASLFAWGMLAYSFLLFLVCQWRGNLFAPRYLSYLVPSAFALYVAMLWMVCRFVASRIPPRFFRARAWHLFLLWALTTGVAKIPQYGKDLTKDIPRAREQRIYGVYDPACDHKFPGGGEVPPLEALNRKCRGFPAP